MSVDLANSTSQLDLSQCDSEPVHIPGLVQPHGLLFVLDAGDLRITGVSNNIEGRIGLAPAHLLGRSIASVTTTGDFAELSDSLARKDFADRNPFKLTLMNGQRFDAIAHSHDGRLILECEPENAAEEFRQDYFYNRIRGSLVRLRGTTSIQELCEQTAREVRLLTGFDRVLIYAFRPDWSGEVVAEECVDGLTKYLGLRFPASDIPRQARELYTSCRLRMLPTSIYSPAALLTLREERPVDLTHATLRSVSPVHLEYMKNMGVTASLGLSLMHDHHLWGLITCNHESGDRFVPYTARTAVALLEEIVSSLISTRERMRVSEQRLAFQDTQARLIHFVAQDRDAIHGLTTHVPSLLDVANSAGAVLFHNGEIHCMGKTPPRAELSDLLTWIDGQDSGSGGLAMESLPAHYAPAHLWKDVGCGLLAARIAFGDSSVMKTDTWLLWFRPEVAQTVSWGGDPNKPLAKSLGNNQRLHPRTSFRLWKEVVHLTSSPFKPAEIAAAQSLAHALTDVILDIEASRQIKEAALRLEESNRQVLHQIEESRKVEIELRRAQKLEAVGRLAAGVAHEINTPLQFVNDSVQFLQEATGELFALLSSKDALEDASHEPPPVLDDIDFDYLKENVPQAILRSLEGLKRVSTIVGALKQFAQPDGVEMAPADLNQALANTVEIARGELAGVADVTLELTALPLIPCYLGDLNQVFLNLMVNAGQAVKDTPALAGKRGLISIKSWHAGSDVFVTIADDGPGIPEAIRESVFLPFFTTREVGAGTGQGLAICHDTVVEKHGGSLTFESEVGLGTTFTIRLPTTASRRRSSSQAPSRSL